MSERGHWETHRDELLKFVCQKRLDALPHILESIYPQTSPERNDLHRDTGKGGEAVHVLVKRLKAGRLDTGGFEQAVELLCQHGVVDINKTHGKGRGQTPLELLCQSYFQSMKRCAPTDSLESICTASSGDDGSDSAMFKLLTRDKQDEHAERQVECLLRNGAHLPKLHSHYLHVLLKRKCSRVVQTFIRFGENPFVLDKKGRPLLTVAVGHSDTNLVKCMLTHSSNSTQHSPNFAGAFSSGVSAGGGPTANGQVADLINPSSHDNVRGLTPQLISDTLTVAARQNNLEIIEALHDHHITANTPSALFVAADHVDGAALKRLLRLGKWKSSDARNSLLLHSALRLMEVCLLEDLSDDSPSGDSSHSDQIDQKLKVAIESFEQSLHVDEHFKENREISDGSRRIPAINIAGQNITEAKNAEEFQALLSTAIPSRSAKPLSAIHLHGLLVMERLRDPRCEIYFSKISGQLWLQSDPSEDVACALAYYDLLHYMNVAGSTSEVCPSEQRRLYRLRHQFQCATSVCVLLQYLLPELSPGHPITVLPVFEWLHGLITGPLKERRQELFYMCGKIFGESKMMDKTELQQSVKLFSNLAKEKGSEWNLLLEVVTVEAMWTRCHGIIDPVVGQRQLPTYVIDSAKRVLVQKESAAPAKSDQLAFVASTLLGHGMPVPDLPGYLVYHCFLQNNFSKLLEVLVSYGLNVWTRDSSGWPLVCSAVSSDHEPILRVILPAISMLWHGSSSDEEAEKVYRHQLQKKRRRSVGLVVSSN